MVFEELSVKERICCETCLVTVCHRKPVVHIRHVEDMKSFGVTDKVTRCISGVIKGKGDSPCQHRQWSEKQLKTRSGDFFAWLRGKCIRD